VGGGFDHIKRNQSRVGFTWTDANSDDKTHKGSRLGVGNPVGLAMSAVSLANSFSQDGMY
jgi:hypothetical protein